MKKVYKLMESVDYNETRISVRTIYDRKPIGNTTVGVFSLLVIPEKEEKREDGLTLISTELFKSNRIHLKTVKRKTAKIEIEIDEFANQISDTIVNQFCDRNGYILEHQEKLVGSVI